MRPMAQPEGYSCIEICGDKLDMVTGQPGNKMSNSLVNHQEVYRTFIQMYLYTNVQYVYVFGQYIRLNS